MSAEITPEQIAELRRAMEEAHARGAEMVWPQHTVTMLLDALEPYRDELEQARTELEDERERVNVQREDIRTLRAEVQRLQLERDAAIDERNAWRSGDQDSRIEADRLRGEVQRLEEEVAGYKAMHASHNALVRELDVILSGHEGVAKQASLCDLIGPAKELREVARRRL